MLSLKDFKSDMLYREFPSRQALKCYINNIANIVSITRNHIVVQCALNVQRCFIIRKTKSNFPYCVEITD